MNTENHSSARKDEIIAACAKLYETMSFKEITIKEIGKLTSFTRTSIYNYFQTREAIFLALMEKDYADWAHELSLILSENEQMTLEDFADKIAHSLEHQGRLLKLLSMNLYDIEGNTDIDSLVSFKKTYLKTIDIVKAMVIKFLPDKTDKDADGFIYSFFPFIFGIYPYTEVTDKQKKAMEIAGLKYRKVNIYEITYPVVIKLLK